MRSLNVAVSQMEISVDCRKNSRAIQKVMSDAAADGCDLVQFPEGALSGYAKTQIANWDGIDWIAIEDELDAIKKTAAQLNLWVVVGSAHRLEAPKRPKNSLYVISNEGAIVARYDKRILSYTEQKDWYSPGEAPVVFEVNGLKVGLALCIEVQFSEVFSRYRDQGVDIILLSSYSNDPMFEVTARAHASLNNTWIGFCIPTNEAGALRSHLIGPDGSLQVSVDAKQRNLVGGLIEPESIEWDIPLRKAKPWRQSIRDSDSFRRAIL